MEAVPPSAFTIYRSPTTRLSVKPSKTHAQSGQQQQQQQQQQKTKLLATSLALSDDIHIRMPKSEGGRWHEKWTNQGWVQSFGAHQARLQGLLSINAANEPGPENEAIQAEAQISSHALLHESGSKVTDIHSNANNPQMVVSQSLFAEGAYTHAHSCQYLSTSRFSLSHCHSFPPTLTFFFFTLGLFTQRKASCKCAWH
jgi:hypothetical protein